MGSKGSKNDQKWVFLLVWLSYIHEGRGGGGGGRGREGGGGGRVFVERVLFLPSATEVRGVEERI